jgi:hypothetical protein
MLERRPVQDFGPTMPEFDFQDNFHHHSGNFNHVAKNEFSGAEFSPQSVTQCNIQCGSGNFDISNFYYHSGILNYFQFQYNSGKLDLAIGGTACGAMATWPMHAKQFQHSAGC